MAYKAFSPDEQEPFASSKRTNISLSEDSPCASHLHFFTGVRSFGKVNVFDQGNPASFDITTLTEIKYNWNFDGYVLPGQTTLTAAIYDGAFLSSADQFFATATNPSSSKSHQDIFRFAQSYLYRADKDLIAYGGAVAATALDSSSSAGYTTDVVREINTRKDLFQSGIKPQTFRMQVNDSNTSITGAINGASANSAYTGTTLFGSQTPNVSGFTTALDIKNPFGGVVSTTKKSFFGVDVQRDGSNVKQTTQENLDSVRTACTIEAIVRPFRGDSIIYFRRLTSGVGGAEFGDSLTQNNFMKLELTNSPDGTQPAFRFSIRTVAAAGDFTSDFAQSNVQASGLFIPNDVGINLFDGNFHHIVVSWDIYEFDDLASSANAELGAGIVLGYIDNFKLQNREQVFPRLSGADAADGPVVQANMVENRIPVKQTAIYGALGNSVFNLNNVYIGASNYNRPNGDTKGDIGVLATQYDGKLQGMYDGQIQHLRVWNQRLKDGYSEWNLGIGQQLTLSASNADTSTSVAFSYNNFQNSTLTSTSAANIAAWWYFNNINGVSGADIAGGLSAASQPGDSTGVLSSNNGSVIGNGKVKLFDNKNIALGTSGNTISDLQVSAIPRDYLYFDQKPMNSPVNNFLPQGQLLRIGVDNAEHRIGLVYYDLGLATMDGDDPTARLNWTFAASGTTGDMGFAVSGLNNTSFNFQRIVFDNQENIATLLLNATASGNEMNFAGNRTGYSTETEQPVFDDPTTYITSVGLYNHNNDLLAIAKLAKPVRKDDTITLTTQVKLDF
tara:strand:- start:1109 stop:3466 length:2358 start_codon:yes stop_codon:yes gene_type:complete